MFDKRRLVAGLAVIGALALPVASAGAATTPVNDSSLGSPRCPDNYAGPTNLATGCPYWLMIS
jgi:hypothetical protein